MLLNVKGFVYFITDKVINVLKKTFQRRTGVKYVSRTGIIDIKAMCKILNGVINNNSGAQKKIKEKEGITCHGWMF